MTWPDSLLLCVQPFDTVSEYLHASNIWLTSVFITPGRIINAVSASKWREIHAINSLSDMGESRDLNKRESSKTYSAADLFRPGSYFPMYIRCLTRVCIDSFQNFCKNSLLISL